MSDSQHDYSRNVADLTDLDGGPNNRRVRRGATQSRPIREFTVYTSNGDPGTPVRADKVETVGDWFTLYLNGEEVYGAPRDKVLQYTAKPTTEAA